MRSMEYSVGGQRVYYSTFDEGTGNIVRVVDDLRDDYRRGSHRNYDLSEKVRKKYPNRWDRVPSPSPELVDVAITNRCSFGCSYCYQDSQPQFAHGRKDLVETMLQGFEHVPYQIAIGGGEPTQHPDFPYILRKARELGTIPNYTTAGFRMTDEIAAATNDVCGGVAMTYHAFKGFPWFKEHYLKLKKALRVKLNIHLIADKDVAKNLKTLANDYKELGPLSVVLLAYYPEIGRSTFINLMTRTTYMKSLPEAVIYARNLGVDISFSEGLLPYFLSRPELGVNTQFATRSEGVFSCYVDSQGRMSPTSFSPPREDLKGLFDDPSQKLWEHLWTSHSEPGGESCYDCPDNTRCSVPDRTHYFICAKAPHNLLPLNTKEEPVVRKPWFEILGQEED